MTLPGLLLAFLATALSTQAPPRDAAVEAAVRHFYATYASGDLEALEALWEPHSPSLAAFREDTAPLLRARCLTLYQVTFDSVEVANDRATVKLHVLLSKSGRTMPERYDPHSAIVELVRRDDGWRVTRWTLGEEAFAARLLAAHSDAERQDLLQAEPRLVTPALGRALCRLGVLAANQQRLDDVATLVKLGRTVAATTGDLANLSLAVGLDSIFERVRPEGNAARSLALAEESLHLAEESSDSDAVSKSALRLGRTLYALDNKDEALHRLQQSFALRDEVEDDSSVSLAAGKITQVLSDRGDRHAAMVYAEIASATAKNDIARASAEMNLGGEYALGQHDYRLGIPHLRRSIDLARASGYRGGVPEAAWVLAECYMKVDQYDEAFRILNSALAELGTAAGAESAPLLLRERSRYFTRKGQLARAEADLREIARLARVRHTPGMEAFALCDLAFLRLRQHRYREAWTMADDVMRRFTAFNPDSLLVRAKAERHLGRRAAAYRTLRRLIEETEENALGFTSDESRRQYFFASRAPAYVELADMLVEDGRFAEALVVAERSKGRLLLDILREGKLLQYAALTAEEHEKEAALERRVSVLNRQSVVSPADELEVALPLREARRHLEEYRKELCEKYPRLVQKAPPTALSLRDTSALLPDSSAAFVEYFVTEKRLVIFVVTRGAARTLHVHVVPLAASRLERETDALTRALAENDLHFRSRSRRLYDLLLAPAAPELQHVKTIAIIPDGPLWRLPFESLLMPDGRFVLERMACFYAPSIAVYREMVRRRPHPAGNFLAFANPPVPASDDASEAKLRDTEKGRLPDAEREVETIARLFHGGTRLYLGADALESRAKAESSGYGVIHFATHGVLDDNNPMYSHLLLASAPGSSDDGFLEMWELMRLDLHAELAVLSACDTARGSVHAGEGLIGMSWALFVAGCSSAVATQWKVPSAAAADLMIDFYRQWLHSGRDTWFAKAEALRQARLHLLHDGKHGDPFYWSGYVLVGSGR